MRLKNLTLLGLRDITYPKRNICIWKDGGGAEPLMFLDAYVRFYIVQALSSLLHATHKSDA